MKTIFTILISSFIHTIVFSQKIPASSIPISKSYVIPSIGEQILIELKSANLDFLYNGTEIIEIFNPDDEPIGSDILALCFMDNCFAQNQGSIELPLNVPSGIIDGQENSPRPEIPLGLILNQNLKQGKYVLVVRNMADKKVIHRRVLTLVYPEPEITGIAVEYPEGFRTDGKILINQNNDLNGVKFIFSGRHLNNKFKSVTIQGMKLRKLEEPNTYVTDNWTAQELKAIDLENPKVTFERDYVSKKYTADINIEAQPPVITGNLVRKINSGQNGYTLSLDVTYLFNRAQLKLGELDGNNLLVDEEIFDGATVNMDNGTITQRILFNDGALNNGNGKFSVQVINRDGQASEIKTIQMQVSEASVTATPFTSKKPFIEGILSQVEFKRSDSAPVFEFVGNMKLKMNGIEQVIVPRNIDGAQNQFSAEVDFPEGSIGIVPFELLNNGNSWRGYFERIADRPKLINAAREVFVGSSVLLHLKDRNDKVTATVSSVEDGIKLIDNNFNDAVVEIDVDRGVPINTSFSIKLYYEDQIFETVDYIVKTWPKPESVIEFKTTDMVHAVDPTKKIIVSQNEAIVLQSKKDQLKKTTSKLTAQLIKSDGTKLGTPQSMVYDDENQIASTSLSHYGFGIKGGDEFMVELVNPLSQPVLQRVYVKRTFWERILANAGVSAVNVFLKERKDANNEALPRISLITGVNLGVYYMVETTQGGVKRPFGYGINIIAQEAEEDVKIRLGTSMLFYETLSLGLSFGDGGTAFFIGANVSFLDLSKIFGN